MKCVFKHQDSQPLEIVGRGSKTQLQMCTNCNYLFYQFKGEVFHKIGSFYSSWVGICRSSPADVSNFFIGPRFSVFKFFFN